MNKTLFLGQNRRLCLAADFFMILFENYWAKARDFILPRLLPDKNVGVINDLLINPNHFINDLASG